MAAHLGQIERISPKVNAIVTLVGDRAMADAARADEMTAKGATLGVLHGLPVAHKDLVDTAGIRTTRGSRFYQNNVPTRDALIVERIHAAGALTVGKTNTPEFGVQWVAGGHSDCGAASRRVERPSARPRLRTATQHGKRRPPL